MNITIMHGWSNGNSFYPLNFFRESDGHAGFRHEKTTEISSETLVDVEISFRREADMEKIIAWALKSDLR